MVEKTEITRAGRSPPAWIVLVQGIETMSRFDFEADTGLARAFRKTCAIRFSKNDECRRFFRAEKADGELSLVVELSQLLFESGLYSLQRRQYRLTASACQPRPPVSLQNTSTNCNHTSCRPPPTRGRFPQGPAFEALRESCGDGSGLEALSAHRPALAEVHPLAPAISRSPWDSRRTREILRISSSSSKLTPA